MGTREDEERGTVARACVGAWRAFWTRALRVRALGLTGNQPYNTSSAGQADATTPRGDTASLPQSRTAVALRPLSRCLTCPLPECEDGVAREPRGCGSWRIPARKPQGWRAPGTSKTLTNCVGDNAGPREGWLRAVRSRPLQDGSDEPTRTVGRVQGAFGGATMGGRALRLTATHLHFFMHGQWSTTPSRITGLWGSR